jgi:hypothetical protein
MSAHNLAFDGRADRRSGFHKSASDRRFTIRPMADIQDSDLISLLVYRQTGAKEIWNCALCTAERTNAIRHKSLHERMTSRHIRRRTGAIKVRNDELNSNAADVGSVSPSAMRPRGRLTTLRYEDLNSRPLDWVVPRAMAESLKPLRAAVRMRVTSTIFHCGFTQMRPPRGGRQSPIHCRVRLPCDLAVGNRLPILQSVRRTATRSVRLVPLLCFRAVRGHESRFIGRLTFLARFLCPLLLPD